METEKDARHSKAVLKEPNCTEKCRSKQHGEDIWEIASSGSDEEVIALWENTCQNYPFCKDELNRTALHAAASFGRIKCIDWLIKKKSCNINAKDSNGYTGLHRAMYFGQIHAVRNLISLNADVNIKDNEYLTPLGLLHQDFKHATFNEEDFYNQELHAYRNRPKDCYVWGTNDNHNLGLKSQQPKAIPELLDRSGEIDETIIEVSQGLFHTIFNSAMGSAFTCGHGFGGRLGHGDEKSLLTPKRVKFRHSSSYDSPCIRVAAGGDHSLFLMADGKVFSCGSNLSGALGFGKNIEKSFYPKMIEVLKTKICGVQCGRSHSIFYTKNNIYSCGLNDGQLGLSKSSGSIVFLPTKIQYNWIHPIVAVDSTDFATAACTNAGEIIIWHRFVQRRIVARQLAIVKINLVSIIGFGTENKPVKFHQKPSKEIEYVDYTPSDISILILCKDGRLIMWREEDAHPVFSYQRVGIPYKCGTFSRITFNVNRSIMIADVVANANYFLFTTREGEAYKASWQSTILPPAPAFKSESERENRSDFQVSLSNRSYDKKIKFMEEKFKVKRIQNIYDGLYASCDPKGHNCTILQANCMQNVTMVPTVQHPELPKHMQMLLNSSMDSSCQFHDVIFIVENQIISAHSYVIASRCPDLYEKVKAISFVDDIRRVPVKDVRFSIFKALVEYLYSGFLHLALSSSDESGEKVLREIYKIAKSWALEKLSKAIKSWLSTKYSEPKDIYFQVEDIAFDPSLFEDLMDVTIETVDGHKFRAHKCILVVRVEYFRSMFMSHWIEASSKKPLKFDCSRSCFAVFLEYIYRDSCKDLDKKDLDCLVECLILSDLMLDKRFMSLVEFHLAFQLGFKNAVHLLRLACGHNAVQLKTSCLEFITMNMPFFIENRYLDFVEDQCMDMLTNYYQRRKHIYNRNIGKEGKFSCTQYSEALASMDCDFQEVVDDVHDSEDVTPDAKKVTKGRARVRSRNYSENGKDEDLSDVRCIESSPLAETSAENRLHKDNFEKVTRHKQRKESFFDHSNPNLERRDSEDLVALTKSTENIAIKNIEKLPADRFTAIDFPSLESPTINKCKDKALESSSKCGARKKTKWRPFQVKLTEEKDLKIGSNVLTVKESENPWKIRAESREDTNFNAIVQQEEKKRENLEKAISKPLKHTQIEDEAMNQLLSYYNNEDVENGIEMVKIRRVQPDQYADPVWVSPSSKVPKEKYGSSHGSHQSTSKFVSFRRKSKN